MYFVTNDLRVNEITKEKFLKIYGHSSIEKTKKYYKAINADFTVWVSKKDAIKEMEMTLKNGLRNIEYKTKQLMDDYHNVMSSFEKLKAL